MIMQSDLIKSLELSNGDYFDLARIVDKYPREIQDDFIEFGEVIKKRATVGMYDEHDLESKAEEMTREAIEEKREEIRKDVWDDVAKELRDGISDEVRSEFQEQINIIISNLSNQAHYYRNIHFNHPVDGDSLCDEIDNAVKGLKELLEDDQ